MRGPVTWAGLIEQVEREHQIQLQGMSVCQEAVWSLYSPPENEEEFLASDVRESMVARFPQLAQSSSFPIAISADLDPNGDAEDVDEDADLPDIKFIV